MITAKPEPARNNATNVPNADTNATSENIGKTEIAKNTDVHNTNIDKTQHRQAIPLLRRFQIRRRIYLSPEGCRNHRDRVSSHSNRFKRLAVDTCGGSHRARPIYAYLCVEVHINPHNQNCNVAPEALCSDEFKKTWNGVADSGVPSLARPSVAAVSRGSDFFFPRLQGFRRKAAPPPACYLASLSGLALRQTA